jgi:dihydroneopterin aldolase
MSVTEREGRRNAHSDSPQRHQRRRLSEGASQVISQDGNHTEREDEVFLEGLRFYAYHGNNPEERVQGQRFVVDVRLWADLRAAGATDDLDQTINYSAVYRQVRQIVEGEPRNLVEAVASQIAETLLTEFAAIQAVTVTVRKPEVAIKGAILDAAGVRIHRRREQTNT